MNETPVLRSTARILIAREIATTGDNRRSRRSSGGHRVPVITGSPRGRTAAPCEEEGQHPLALHRGHRRRRRRHAVGLFGKELGGLKPLGTAFVELIKMMISPIIFCTIVLGIGSVRQAAQVGKVGGLALLYFIAMSTFALVIGLLVGNMLHPGDGLQAAGRAAAYRPRRRGADHHRVPARHHPDHAGLAADRRVGAGGAVRRAARRVRRAGPGQQGPGRAARGQALRARGLPHPVDDHVAGPDRRVRRHRRASSARPAGPPSPPSAVMLGFYITCFLFVVVILGALLKRRTGLWIFKLMKYLAPGVPADRRDLVVRDRAAAADREDGAHGRLPPRRRHHRARPATRSTSTAPRST